MQWIKRLKIRWNERAKLGDQDLARQELAFLPAALEIKEKPPHPASRVTAWVLICMFTIGLVWACLGEVDIVATAEGKIIPSGQVKQIQPYERAVVSTILVKEGQWVKQGQALIELDRGQTRANQKQLEQELQQNRLNHQRLEYFKRYLDYVVQSNGLTSALTVAPDSNKQGTSLPVSDKRRDKPETAAKTSPAVQTSIQSGAELDWPESTAYQQQQQTLLLQQQREGVYSELMRLQQQLADRAAEQEVNQALINKLKGTLPLITQRVEALKKLMQQKMAARVQYLELEQNRVEQQQDLIAARASDRRLIAQIEELRHQRYTFVTQSRSDNLQQLLQSDREFLSLTEEFNKAKDLNRKQVLTSPVDGFVQELAVHTVGGVVTEAQPLMKIVPEHQQLEVEAWLENKDIGFVYPEQQAEIKIHTFPFTKYGIIDGKVETVSADATVDEQRGLIYKAKVLLAKDSLLVEGRNVPLVPGMSVSTEIKIGKRLLIEYITAPLLRYKSESLDER